MIIPKLSPQPRGCQIPEPLNCKLGPISVPPGPVATERTQIWCGTQSTLSGFHLPDHLLAGAVE